MIVHPPKTQVSLGQGFSLAPSQLKKEQKLPKMVYIIPNFLVLHFGENFMEIWTKIPKLQKWDALNIA